MRRTATRRPRTAPMLDDFFVRALLAGAGVALIAGPLGCFIVWRRLAYFGDTLAHAALLGVAFAFIFEVNATLAVLATSLMVAVALLGLRREQTVSSDALLGLLSHGSLALGLVCLSFLTTVRVDLLGLLFGDILAVSKSDILVIYLLAVAIGLVLWLAWRPLFAATVSRDLAEAEGLSPARTDFLLMVLLAAVIAVAMKIVGVLLITALLIIPATTARRLTNGPEPMAIVAALVGLLSVVGGLFGSLSIDTPAGPSIVVAALVLFVISLSPLVGLLRRMHTRETG